MMKWHNRAVSALVVTAALHTVADVRAAGVRPESATAVQKQEATGLYTAGVDHYRAQRFKEAAQAFLESYEVVASPNSHMMYARSLLGMNELGSAYEALARAYREASLLAEKFPKYRDSQKTAARELAQLRPRVAVLKLEVTGEATAIYVGARRVPPVLWPAVVVPAGKVELSARVNGGRRALTTVETELGKIRTVRLDVRNNTGEAVAPPSSTTPAPGPVGPVQDEQPETAATDLRPFAYIAGGVGAVGLLTFFIAGAMSNASFSNLEENCNASKQCAPDQQEMIDAGKTEQTIANVGLVFGILGIGAGAGLYLYSENQQTHAKGWRLQANLRQVTLSARF